MFDEFREEFIGKGARHFVDLPVEAAFFDELYDHTERLEGAGIKVFQVDGVLEMWMEFDFLGQRFAIDNGDSDYRIFVADPDCPEPILLKVIDHYGKLVNR